jgi:hypothetical protein
MEDLKQIQEFFSKPLNENVYVEAFKLEKALKGMGYDVKVKAVDDFGTNVFEIYFNNPADADDDSIFYDVKKLGYDNVRVFANPQELIDEASKEEETEFHTKLDKLVHDTFGKRKGEMEEYNTGIYYKDEKTQDKTKEASKSALEKVKNMIQKVLKEEEGYSKFLKTDDNPEGKTKGLDTATMNKILMNVIKDLDELKQLGEGMIEEELCPKGKAYIKKRQAAGEKSSAYLSGRAVKVCKGQMKG